MTKTGLKIVFAGTPEFSAVALQALLNSQHDVIAVYTQPDRPSGRGRQLTASPVKILAEKNNIKVYQPLVLDQAELAKLNADVMVVAAYGLIFPEEILKTPTFGCLNIHTSLLPRWRGAAPIQRAILAGDTETGVTIIQMNNGLDTGDTLYKKECAIENTDTSATLHDRLAQLGAEAILKVLDDIKNLKPQAQDNSQATYAHKIKKEEGLIEWNSPAEEIERKIRAFNPWPVAQTTLNGETLRVWQASVLSSSENKYPGTIVNVSPAGIDVVAGRGRKFFAKNSILRLQKIQFPGGKVLDVADILNSRKNDFTIGNVLGADLGGRHITV